GGLAMHGLATMGEFLLVYGGSAALCWIIVLWTMLGAASLLRGFPRLKIWQLAGIVGVGAWFLALVVLVFGPASQPEAGIFLLTSLVAVLLGFGGMWLNEFRALMLRRDDEFPGRHDKLVWSVALLLFAPAGVWLFRLYRKAQWPEGLPTSAGESGDGGTAARD